MNKLNVNGKNYDLCSINKLKYLKIIVFKNKKTSDSIY